jgi:hypothetical protein
MLQLQVNPLLQLWGTMKMQIVAQSKDIFFKSRNEEILRAHHKVTDYMQDSPYHIKKTGNLATEEDPVTGIQVEVVIVGSKV